MPVKAMQESYRELWRVNSACEGHAKALPGITGIIVQPEEQNKNI